MTILKSLYLNSNKNLNKYYLIIDQETEQVYFCFERAVREGWQDLVEENFNKLSKSI